MGKCVGKAFNDKRITCLIVVLWIGISVGFYNELGAFEQLEFMTFGPSNHTKFMGAVLDTWPKWGYVASFSLFNTCINEFVNDALVPWVQNTIQDHKTKALPYRKVTCICINLIFTVYIQVTMLFSMFLYMSQIDFLLLRMLGDVIVTVYSTNMFLKAKRVDPYAYDLESSSSSSSFCSSSSAVGQIDHVPCGGPSNSSKPTISIPVYPKLPSSFAYNTLQPMFAQPSQEQEEEKVQTGILVGKPNYFSPKTATQPTEDTSDTMPKSMHNSMSSMRSIPLGP